MKRLLLFVMIAALMSGLAFSQESESTATKTAAEKKGIRAGLQIGTNMEQSDGYTFILGIQTDTALIPDTLLLGTQMDWTFSHSGYTANPSMYLEWLTPLHVANVMTPYLKGNLGMYTLHENDETKDGMLAGLEAGLSFDLGPVYLEPGFLFGYPYMWGCTLRAGLSF